MPVRALIGMQWGDEGKGKVVDALSERVDMVVRAQGGANAGHTVRVGDRTRVLHLIPSGMLYQHVHGVLGNGVVLDPSLLVREIEELADSGIEMASRFSISERAHLVLPYHRAMDAALEELRGGAAIGTTRRGIGPAYMDKAARTGLVAALLREPDRLAERVRAEVEAKRRLLSSVDPPKSEVDADAILDQLLESARVLAPLVTDAIEEVHAAIGTGREVLIEGAQGSLLDLDLGTYPYVTSSSCHLGGLLSGSGIPPKAVERVIGVAKAYCTRVGRGPFPTEETGDAGQWIRDRGVEYGSTTGRPRRCGWLDLIALRFAAMTNGVDEIVLTKADVLAGLSELKVCASYRRGSEVIERWPAGEAFEGLEPAYEVLPGFEAELSRCERYEDLPPELTTLIERIEGFTSCPVSIVSTGPERAQALQRTGATA